MSKELRGEVVATSRAAAVQQAIEIACLYYDTAPEQVAVEVTYVYPKNVVRTPAGAVKKSNFVVSFRAGVKP